ncbi:cyclic nucleotide-binding domain-containing protein [Yoonia sp. SS1-5]|uniref:Cyclic nucleotide-binding domain-containing protein n=1 Tax=Yoonia rhodophyticola TaxID=3137370 RepID=A0AAN0M985_9RHOB
MLTDLTTSSLLITMAGSLQICGYLLINQVYLRLTLLAGTCFYIAYYYTVADAPLWGAILISSLTVLTILIGLVGLYAKHARWAIPKAHADLYPLFDDLPPGDFRNLVTSAKRQILRADIVATTQGQRPDHLYFIIGGTFAVQKGTAAFDVPGPTFAGEVAFLTDGPSAATTRLPAGLEVLVWRRYDLARRCKRSPRFKLAVEAVISRDLARKVALAVAPDTRWVGQ